MLQALRKHEAGQLDNVFLLGPNWLDRLLFVAILLR